MPISTQQLQHAAHYIVDHCKYRTSQFDTDQLSKSDRNHLYDFLYNILLGLKRHHLITINPFQKSMKQFRIHLAQNDILFPERTTIKIHGDGKTYCNKELIFNLNEVKNKAMRKSRPISTEMTPSIRRSSSSVFEQEMPSNPLDDNISPKPTFKRTLSDTDISIKKSASCVEMSSLLFQFTQLKITSSQAQLRTSCSDVLSMRSKHKFTTPA